MSDPNSFNPPPPPPSDPSSVPSSAGAPVEYQSAVGSGYPGPYVGPAPEKDPRMWGMLAHLSALAGGLVGFPLLGPLLVWLLKKQEHPFIDDQGKEALNFHITVTVAFLIAFATMCIGIGFILAPVVGIVALIFTIIGAVKANEGVAYRYPFNIRFVK